MKIFPFLFIIVLLTNCSVSKTLSVEHCREKLGTKVSINSDEFKECFKSRQEHLLKRYAEYQKDSDWCWDEVEKEVPYKVDTIRTYIPSQDIYDDKGNKIGRTEKIDRVDYVQPPENARARKYCHKECMKKKRANNPTDDIKGMIEGIDNLFNYE